MSTTTDDDLDRNDVVIALRREGASQLVRPAPVEQVVADGRRRRVRRRASVAALSTAAVVMVGSVAFGALADGPPDQVRTAEAPVDTSGPGIEPLLVPARSTGLEPETESNPVINSNEVDQLDASGKRAPWWRWGPDPQWSVGEGIVLADGRRFAAASGLYSTERAGEPVIVELDDLGGVQRAIPLDVEVPLDPPGPQEPDQSVSAEVIGAAGSRIDLYVEWRNEASEPTPPMPQPLIAGTAMISLDVDTGTVETIFDDPPASSHRTAGDRIVSVRAAVSTTEPCLLDVRDRTAIDAVRTVVVPCDAPDDQLPLMLRLVALDPTGRYAAVERTTINGTASLLVADLEEETTTEVTTSSGPGPRPWQYITWDASSTLHLAMPTNNPDFTPTDVPALPGGPAIEVIHYQSD
jgi:hypothetical protein